ncbi:hypothetical protein EDC04DRAFT_2604839 [Pisolithus marmoratus]|nr:hypothetical protein EDC04DRAFT_2604839 [Pisolithus marmoratus]
MEKTNLLPSSLTMVNPMDVTNHATERISEHLAAIRVVKDTKVWWDCYKAIWEQLNYIHGIGHSLPWREKSWSNDVPVIGEDLWGVGQSIEKGKGKAIAYCDGSHHPHPIGYCASPP